MKSKIKMYMKVITTVVITIAIVMQALSGLELNIAKAAETEESAYTELSFADWGEFTEKSWVHNIYKLSDEDKATDLNGVAVSGIANFSSASSDTVACINIGGTEGVKHGGFWLKGAGASLTLSPQGIDGTKTEHVVLSGERWAALKTTDFALRLTFDKDETTNVWTVGVYIDNNMIGSYDCGTANPGLYVGYRNVSVSKNYKKEMKFSDWGKSEGKSWEQNVYSLRNTDEITSLDSVAISGTVNFSAASNAANARINMGGTASVKHGGFWLRSDGSSLALSPQGIDGTKTEHVVLSGEQWAALKVSNFALRVTFDKNETTNIWTVGVYINNILTGSYDCGTANPGLYVGQNSSVTVTDISTEMTFGDWGISAPGLYDMPTGSYCLADRNRITDLNGVAISGKVKFNTSNARFRIGGTTYSMRHAGFLFFTEGNALKLVPQAIGTGNGVQNVVGSSEWASLIGTEISLRVAFDKNDDDEWIVAVYVNGLLKGSYNCGKVEPGLWIASNDVVLEDIGGPDIYNPPTEMAGKSLVDRYVTSVKNTDTGVTVISAADADNAYQTSADYDGYGLDYVLDFNVDRDIRILQLTDTQIIDSAQCRTADRLYSAEKDRWKTDQMYNNLFRYIIKTVRDAKPDLILITGDVIYGEFDDDGTSLLAFIKCMDSLKIPWAPIFGNHDNESDMGVGWQCEQLENSPYCLFNRRNEIGGNGNYSIGIAKNGALERVIYMMDNNGCHNSNALNGSEVKKDFGFTDKQKEWYENTATAVSAKAEKTIPSFIAYHAPTKEMLDAVVTAGYQTEESTDTYTLGVNITDVKEGDSGTKGQKNVHTYEEPGLLEIMKRVGTDGAFFGHQHLNSLSVKYEGIRWTFGLKTGTYDESPTVVGGTLITLTSGSGDFAVAQVQINSATMDNIYPRIAYTIPDAPENLNFIYIDMTNNREGYKVTASDATIDGKAVGEGTYYNKAGTPLLTYTVNGETVIRRLILYIQGDANLDNEVNVKDLVRMKKQAAKTYVPNQAGERASDMDGDKQITDTDTNLLRQQLLHSVIIL